jgi:hypothetical protein
MAEIGEHQMEASPSTRYPSADQVQSDQVSAKVSAAKVSAAKQAAAFSPSRRWSSVPERTFSELGVHGDGDGVVFNRRQ